MKRSIASLSSLIIVGDEYASESINIPITAPNTLSGIGAGIPTTIMSQPIHTILNLNQGIDKVLFSLSL